MISTDPHWIGPWVAERAGGTFSPDTMTAIGLIRENSVLAGVMFENWNGKSIVAHMAATGRLTRTFLGVIFQYAYEKCGVEKVILPISSANIKSSKFAKHLGFEEEARISDADPNGDIIIYTLKKGDCRFLGNKYRSVS